MNYIYSKECNNDGGLATDLVHVSTVPAQR